MRRTRRRPVRPRWQKTGASERRRGATVIGVGMAEQHAFDPAPARGRGGDQTVAHPVDPRVEHGDAVGRLRSGRRSSSAAGKPPRISQTPSATGAGCAGVSTNGRHDPGAEVGQTFASRCLGGGAVGRQQSRAGGRRRRSRCRRRCGRPGRHATVTTSQPSSVHPRVVGREAVVASRGRRTSPRPRQRTATRCVAGRSSSRSTSPARSRGNAANTIAEEARGSRSGAVSSSVADEPVGRAGLPARRAAASRSCSPDRLEVACGDLGGRGHRVGAVYAA